MENAGKATKAERRHTPGHTVDGVSSGFKKLVPFQKLVFLSQPENNGLGIPIIYKQEK